MTYHVAKYWFPLSKVNMIIKAWLMCIMTICQIRIPRIYSSLFLNMLLQNFWAYVGGQKPLIFLKSVHILILWHIGEVWHIMTNLLLLLQMPDIVNLHPKFWQNFSKNRKKIELGIFIFNFFCFTVFCTLFALKWYIILIIL